MNIWISKQSWMQHMAASRIADLEFGDVRRIAVIKHGAIGDMVLVRPMLATLRDYFPKAELTLSVVTNYMRGIPEELVDRVHVACGNDRRYGILESYRSYRALGPQDILFDISATSRSFLITALTPARLKIGYMHKGIERAIYDIAIPRAEYRFEAETFLEQLHVLGINYKWPLDYRPTVEPAQRPRPYIVYFPTASSPSKCWPPERFASLIRKMLDKYPGYEHVLLHGLAEWEHATCANITALVGNPRLQQENGSDATPALLAGAHLLVANDTGIRNIAISLNTPTIGIFPYGSPFGYLPRDRHHAVLYHIDGSPVSVEEALVAAENMLAVLPDKVIARASA